MEFHVRTENGLKWSTEGGELGTGEKVFCPAQRPFRQRIWIEYLIMLLVIMDAFLILIYLND
jgi:hypothetical protein